MNVTVVCEGFNGSSVELQPWRHIYEICRFMLRGGVNVVVLSDMAGGEISSEVVDRIPVLHVSQLLWLSVIKKGKMLRILEESNPDVILWSGRPLSCMSLAPLLKLKKPVVWILETGLPDLRMILRLSVQEVWSRYHRFLWNDIVNALLPRRLLKSVANSSSVIKMIVPSRFVKDWLLRIGVSGGKIVVVESGLDQQFRTPLGLMIERSSLAMSESDLIVTYAGSPCTIRGSEIFVRAIQLLLATRRTALKCLVLSRRPVGNTCQHLRDEEAYLKRLIIKLGLEDVFRIIPGVLKREEYTAFMQASDIVVLPFKLLQCEIPLSVLEAMSLGKLVVTTRIRTLQEIAGENRALLIAPGDPYALTRAILDVIQNNHAARRIAAAGQKYAYSLPSWETVGDKTLSILRTAANAVQK